MRICGHGGRWARRPHNALAPQSLIALCALGIIAQERDFRPGTENVGMIAALGQVRFAELEAASNRTRLELNPCT